MSVALCCPCSVRSTLGHSEYVGLVTALLSLKAVQWLPASASYFISSNRYYCVTLPLFSSDLRCQIVSAARSKETRFWSAMPASLRLLVLVCSWRGGWWVIAGGGSVIAVYTV